MDSLADALWAAWLFYWFSAAFLGTLSAVFTAWGIREIYRFFKRRRIAREFEDAAEYDLVRSK